MPIIIDIEIINNNIFKQKNIFSFKYIIKRALLEYIPSPSSISSSIYTELNSFLFPNNSFFSTIVFGIKIYLINNFIN